MQRRILISLACAAIYVVVSLIAGATDYFVTWQAFALLSPAFLLCATLAWTVPYPDFSRSIHDAPEPIETFPYPHRKVIWLNGPWEFQTQKDARWHRFLVPRPWNVIAGLEHFDGVGRFRRVFNIPDGWSQGCVFLNFRGVNYSAVVSIDGRKVGEHKGGFTPFSFDITDRVCDGAEKEIEVVVDSRLSSSTAPSVVGWNNDGGIYREVFLETRNPAHIEDIYVMSEPDMKGRATVSVIVKIHNIELEPKNLRMEVFSPQGALIHEHVVSDWTMQSLQHRFVINFVSLWSPESPALYKLKLCINEKGGDEYTVNFGVKSFRAGQEGFLLNGAPYRIRGITRQEESPRLGRTQSLSLIRDDLEKIKEMGFNTVRLGALPAHPATLEECDRIGLLVFEEAPVWNTLALDLANPAYQKSAEQQLKELIQRDRNHACVAMWGLANRIESNRSESRWLVERLAGIARGLDDKPVYLLSNNPGNELCADLVDCVIVNASTMPREGLKINTKSLNLGPATLIYHRGVAAYRKNVPRLAGAPGTEENQSRFCLDFIDAYDNDPNIAGWLMPALADFRDSANIGGYAPFISATGLLRSDRSEKPARAAITQRLINGARTVPPAMPGRFRSTSFSRIAGALFFGILVIAFIVNIGHRAKLLYNPAAYAAEAGETWSAVALISLFSALSWAVIANRFFLITPRRILGSIDMSYFAIIARIFQTEVSLFIFTYFSVFYFWIFDTTILYLAMKIFHLGPQPPSFVLTLKTTGAFCLPTMLFGLPAYFGVSAKYVLGVIVVWLATLATLTMGAKLAFIYIIIGPAIFVAIPLALIERKFGVLKFLRKALARSY